MEFYHIYNRGVEKRNIVSDDHDRARFLHDLYAFNDSAASSNFQQPTRANWTSDVQFARKPLIQIHAYCLMNNHYHLLLSPVVENGISLFMKKLNMGYAKYFNERHDRTGVLWQGKYKKKAVVRDAYFLYLPLYIHLNPLDYSHPQWRTGGVTNSSKALKDLAGYRWSSHLDYMNVKNFPSLIDTTILRDVFITPHHYAKELTRTITSRDLATLSEQFE